MAVFRPRPKDAAVFVAMLGTVAAVLVLAGAVGFVKGGSASVQGALVVLLIGTGIGALLANYYASVRLVIDATTIRYRNPMWITRSCDRAAIRRVGLWSPSPRGGDRLRLWTGEDAYAFQFSARFWSLRDLDTIIETLSPGSPPASSTARGAG